MVAEKGMGGGILYWWGWEGVGADAATAPSSSPPGGSCFTALTAGGGEKRGGGTKGGEEEEEEEKEVWWWGRWWRGGEGKGLLGDPRLLLLQPLPDATIIRFLVPPLNIAYRDRDREG